MMCNTAKLAFLIAGIFGLSFVRSAEAATTNVAYGNFFFHPSAITVHVGDTIVWTNATTSVHTITGTGTVSGTGTEAMCGSGTLNGTCSHTFQNIGVYTYQCNVLGHAAQGMTGLVTVVSAALPPVVNISNPANGAIFSDPANVKLSATATASNNGSVTNVQYFGNGNSLGSATTAPFNLTSAPLVVGSYSLTAKATDSGGLSSTSSPITISVVTAVAISNFQARITNGQFVFDHTATPGLHYAAESSLDLTNWSPVVTNTAVNGTVEVSDGFNGNGLRFYRVRQLPNP